MKPVLLYFLDASEDVATHRAPFLRALELLAARLPMLLASLILEDLVALVAREL